jgi:hypothetical protein
MPLVTQAEYARHQGVSRVTVHLRTAPKGGVIPVHGPRKLIDVAEADALWHATMSPQGAGRARAEAERKRRAAGTATAPPGDELARARAAALVLDVQTKRLNLEQRRGQLISRDRAVLRCFAFARLFRDTFLSWPARAGPLIAAQYDIDATALTVTLESHVREQLAVLSRERPEF